MAVRSKTSPKDSRAGQAPKPASTISGVPVEALYTPEDLGSFRYDEKLGDPGEFPYTRGIYPSMYRGQLWTMRQVAGYVTREYTNRLYNFLLSQGQTGFAVPLDT